MGDKRMKIIVDTHTHTLASGHAYSTIQEMALAAKERGMEAICFTEHAPMMPGSCSNFYFQNFRIIPRERWGIRTLFGAELNIMNEKGELDLPQAVISKLDLAIASIHMPCYKGEFTKDELTAAVIRTMENPYINIIGHPDDSRTPVDYEMIVKAAKRTGTLLEINNSSLRPGYFRQNAHENLKELLYYCKKYEVMVATGSDAHIDVDAGEFSHVYKVLEDNDFPEELVANTSWEKLKPFLNCFK